MDQNEDQELTGQSDQAKQPTERDPVILSNFISQIRKSLNVYFYFILIAVGIGSVAIFLYALPAPNPAVYFSIVVTSLLFGWAVFAGGALLGFIFGVPISSAAQTKTAEERGPTQEQTGEQKPADGNTASAPPKYRPLNYRPNTNLEQISDWLTKILVGVGLTQLLSLPGRLQELGKLLAPAMGNFGNSSLFVMGEVVFYGVCGFLASYIWTRVNLPKLYALADTDSILANERNLAQLEGEAIGYKRGIHEEGLRAMPFIQPESRALSTSGETGPTLQSNDILWVDDHPEYNIGEAKALSEKLGVKITYARSTFEALSLISKGSPKYHVIISDMGRPESRTAGYDLLKQLRDKKSKIPFIIYATGATPEKQSEAVRLGAFRRPIGPVELFDAVQKALLVESS